MASDTEGANDHEWMYIDNSGATKGPVSASIIMKFLDKGLVISPTNHIWTAGMELWKPIVEVFETIVEITFYI